MGEQQPVDAGVARYLCRFAGGRVARLPRPLGFFVANLVVYWSGWTTVWKLMVAVLIGFVLLPVGFFALLLGDAFHAGITRIHQTLGLL